MTRLVPLAVAAVGLWIFVASITRIDRATMDDTVSVVRVRDRVYHAHAATVNAVLGDESFMKTFGFLPGEDTEEDIRIATHLAYVESILRTRNVGDWSDARKRARGQTLDLLHEFWMRGVFPRNDDYLGVRKPCFIDERGRICAIGFMIERTTGRRLAEEIDRRYHHAYVEAMNVPAFDTWIKRSGLTLHEVAMIQPQYGGADSAVDSLFLTETRAAVPAVR